jgi:hypothetical protein
MDSLVKKSGDVGLLIWITDIPSVFMSNGLMRILRNPLILII